MILFHSSLFQVCFVSSYACQALLVYYYTTNQSLSEAAVSARLSGSEGLMGAGLQVRPASTDVGLIGEELHTREMSPCFTLISLPPSQPSLVSTDTKMRDVSVCDPCCDPKIKVRMWFNGRENQPEQRVRSASVAPAGGRAAELRLHLFLFFHLNTNTLSQDFFIYSVCLLFVSFVDLVSCLLHLEFCCLQIPFVQSRVVCRLVCLSVSGLYSCIFLMCLPLVFSLYFIIFSIVSPFKCEITPVFPS